MKILIIYPDFYVYGGGEVLAVRLCNYLTKRGVENAILTMSMIPEVQRELANTRVYVVEKKPSSIGKLLTLCREVRNLSAYYDIINPHNYPAEITAISSRKPSVWMCNEPELHLSFAHNKFRFKTRAYLKTLMPCEKYIVRNYIKQCVVADRSNADRFKRIYKRDPVIINYGVDSDYFSNGDRESARIKLGIGNEFVVLHVGMLTKLKNQLDSLKVINELKGRIPSIRLVLAGYWHVEYKLDIDKYINDNNLAEYVRVTGHIDKRELRNWYHAADVLLHPIKAQGGWLSPFEALSAGLPIVVSNTMTASAMIKSNGLGTVTDDYMTALKDVYVRRDYYRNNAAKGAEWVKNNLSWELFGQKMLELFKSAQSNLS